MDRWGCVDARAGVIDSITARLWRFSPRVEPSPHERGVYWLDASGLRFVYSSLHEWAACIRADLRSAGLDPVVASGFTRFGTYAAARSGAQVVFDDPEHERAFVRRVSLAHVGIDPDLRGMLDRLGVRTVGAFLDLPVAGIRRRFGSAAEELHRLARDDGWTPLAPVPFIAPVERAVTFEYPEGDLDRLLGAVGELLPALIDELSDRFEALASLSLTLVLDYGGSLCEEISPASPSADCGQMLVLVRLRLESVALASGVVELRVRAVGARIAEQQIALFSGTSPQCIRDAQRGLAQVRAQLGDGAVVQARLADGHLPEAALTWEPLRTLAAPAPAEVAVRPLVRRFYSPPVPLPSRPKHEPDGWLVTGLADGPVEEVIGPQVVSGGWWMREAERAYYYLRTRSGRVLWVFRDKRRRRWFLHGEVQ